MTRKKIARRKKASKKRAASKFRMRKLPKHPGKEPGRANVRVRIDLYNSSYHLSELREEIMKHAVNLHYDTWLTDNQLREADWKIAISSDSYCPNLEAIASFPESDSLYKERLLAYKWRVDNYNKRMAEYRLWEKEHAGDIDDYQKMKRAETKTKLEKRLEHARKLEKELEDKLRKV